MKGLDFWATDASTDADLPIFDEWSSTFRLREWIREVTQEEIMQAWGSSLNQCRLDQKPKSNEVVPWPR